MKFIISAIAVFFITTITYTTQAQTTAPPIAQIPAVPTKIAIIDTEAFGDNKTGIKRLVNAYSQLDNELAPLRQDLINKNNRLQALAQKASAGTITTAEAEEADNLKREIQRRQEDGQKQMERRTKDLTEPIFTNIASALQAYAKQRGFDIIVDVAKMPGALMVVNQGIDITGPFITDFNSRNAAPATATTPVKP